MNSGNLNIQHCPIQMISGVWQFSRPPYYSTKCYSTPGHLIHYVAEGSYLLIVDGIQYRVKQGDILYYFETEEVKWVGDHTNIVFYSIAFTSSEFQPLGTLIRGVDNRQIFESLFKKAYEIFTFHFGIRKKLSLFSVVAQILSSLMEQNHLLKTKVSGFECENIWKVIEYEIRKRRLYRTSLKEICHISGYSEATITRLCKAATGDTPIKRVQLFRMEEAKGLLVFSPLTISEIANRLQYPRIHEFSREFKKYTGATPSEFRSESSVT